MTASQWRRSFRALWFSQFISIAGLTVVVPLLPFYMEELGAHGDANRWWTGLALAAPAITLCLSSPIWGRIGDRWGRKWMVVRAVFGLSVSVAFMGVAQTPLQFLFWRLVQGSFGGVVDAAAAFAGCQAPEKARGKSLGFLQSATAAGSLVGPLIGGLLADLWGFRPLFWLMGGLTAVAGLIAMIVLKEPAREPVKESEKRASFAQISRSLLENRGVRSLILAGICAQAGVFGLVTVFAPMVRDMAGSDQFAATWVGGLQAATWGATILGAPWWGRKNDRGQIERHFFWASAGCGVSIFLQILPHDPAWLIPLRILQGFCFSALLQSVFLKVTRHAGEAVRGTSIGVTNSFLVFGQVLGSLGTAWVGGWLPVEWVIILLGTLFMTGALLVHHQPRFGGPRLASWTPSRDRQ
ncbi:MFS transporter [Salinithrix halophila]|uniref:MFS transporter n=1 Tax=Salinithrix halophila TaxID=1485204 RepID=A0ABV8JBB6_9BACL